MVHAYVMVKTGAAESESIISTIQEMPEVAEAHIVAGDYDIVAEVSVDDVYSVLHAAASKMQSLDGTVETKTYISLD